MFEGTRGGAAEGRIGGNWRQRIQRLRLCRKSRPPGLKIDREKRYAGTGAKTIRSNGRFCDLKRNLFSPRSMARRTFSTELNGKRDLQMDNLLPSSIQPFSALPVMDRLRLSKQRDTAD